MDTYTINLMVEREQRRFLAEKFSDWEAMNGIMLMPEKLDPKKDRITQLVDDALKYQALFPKGQPQQGGQ
jgi:hypothetical protein